ncbi:IS3 family transposase [Anaeromicrobium sediminis]|uniref:IS3 family transposase n=1 Tax=Anaeromicrobium sediminis TaxID=1478221 RepID=UPI00159572A7
MAVASLTLGFTKFFFSGIFIKGLHEYIYYYNNRRIKSKLKIAPVEYRNQLSVA